MSDSSIIEARLSVLEHRLSEVQANLQKTESTQPFKIEPGKVFIEEAPIENASINAKCGGIMVIDEKSALETRRFDKDSISTVYSASAYLLQGIEWRNFPTSQYASVNQQSKSAPSEL